MAAKKIGLSVSLSALALVALALPSLASADDSRGKRAESSESRGSGDARGGDRRGGEARGGGDRRGSDDSNRGGGGWQRQAPQQAAPQAQQSSQPGGWQGRGSWAGRAAQTEAAPAPAQAPRAQWGGSDDRRSRGDEARSRGNEDRSRGGWGRTDATTQAPVQRTSSGDGRRQWQGSTSEQPRSGDSWRRDRDRDRDGSRDDNRWQRDRSHDRTGDRWRGSPSGRATWAGSRHRSDDRQRYQGNHRNWNHDWRRDNRYNWYSYRNKHRNHYQLGHYYAPYRHYSYRRLSIGFFLDSLFFSSRYYINDPWQYRLPEAYGPYRWVRYYDDALLVDIYSGEVVDVIHDFFW